jgi:membrane protein YqaA with SNARE-associated domain
MNAEIIVLTLPAFADSSADLIVLVVVATAGQIIGKCVMYWAGREGRHLFKPRADGFVMRWRNRLASEPRKAAVFFW